LFIRRSHSDRIVAASAEIGCGIVTHTFMNARARLRPTSSRSLTLPSILSDRQIAVRRSSAGGNYNPEIQRCSKMIERERDNSAGDYRETINRPTLSSNSNATTIKRQPHPQHEACMFIRAANSRSVAEAGPPKFCEFPPRARVESARRSVGTFGTIPF
jgi:hypothetical protein